MKVLVDTHTHTCVSAHAYSTLKENLDIAKEKGLEMIVMTDHAPNMVDGAHMWHFYSMAWLPKKVNGIKILSGIEVDVLDGGILDVCEKDFVNHFKPEVVVASFHEPLYKPKTMRDHTEAWLNVVRNPMVDICGHSGDPRFIFEIEPVIMMAKKYNKCIEINNNSFVVRNGSRKFCLEIAKMCKKIGTKIVVSSDAHSCWQVGEFGDAIEMLKEIDFDEELVMNITAEKFINYLEELHFKKIDF
ncbi:MAG: phosphatase [Clostridiales bacterium]|jgi:putative hydrolase|nr:phosphatase [Clostridiales bacterium]